MSDPKDFVAGMGSNARKSPTRVVFVTRRTSAQVKVTDEEQVQTYPEVLFRALVAIEVLTIALVGIALIFNAPLEGIADPSHTPNPAKAPWYFLGLQEMLHYFPPVVAGVLAPGLVVMALIVIPYFNINIEAEGLFLKDRKRRLRIFYVIAAGLSLFLWILPLLVPYVTPYLVAARLSWLLLVIPEMPMYVALAPTLIVAGFMALAAQSSPQSTSAFRCYLASKPLSFWVMTWFLFELAVLTAVGTFFRGPGWCWVLPFGEGNCIIQ
jgi:menaquinol-cytochrome c reductase cytochrome b/c subunit